MIAPVQISIASNAAAAPPVAAAPTSAKGLGQAFPQAFALADSAGISGGPAAGHSAGPRGAKPQAPGMPPVNNFGLVSAANLNSSPAMILSGLVNMPENGAPKNGAPQNGAPENGFAAPPCAEKSSRDSQAAGEPADRKGAASSEIGAGDSSAVSAEGEFAAQIAAALQAPAAAETHLSLEQLDPTADSQRASQAAELQGAQQPPAASIAAPANAPAVAFPGVADSLMRAESLVVETSAIGSVNGIPGAQNEAADAPWVRTGGGTQTDAARISKRAATENSGADLAGVASGAAAPALATVTAKAASSALAANFATTLPHLANSRLAATATANRAAAPPDEPNRLVAAPAATAKEAPSSHASPSNANRAPVAPAAPVSRAEAGDDSNSAQDQPDGSDRSGNDRPQGVAASRPSAAPVDSAALPDFSATMQQNTMTIALPAALALTNSSEPQTSTASLPASSPNPPAPASVPTGAALAAPTSENTIHGAGLLNAAGNAEMHLSIRTEELGTVELRAALHQDALSATIGVTRGDAQTALNSELPGLQRAMAEHSLRFESFQVTKGSSGSLAGHSGGFQPSYQNPQRSHGGSGFAPLARAAMPGEFGGPSANSEPAPEISARLSVRV